MEYFTDQIKRRDFDMLFAALKHMMYKNTRRVSRAQGRLEGADLSLSDKSVKIQNRFP